MTLKPRPTAPPTNRPMRALLTGSLRASTTAADTLSSSSTSPASTSASPLGWEAVPPPSTSMRLFTGPATRVAASPPTPAMITRREAVSPSSGRNR